MTGEKHYTLNTFTFYIQPHFSIRRTPSGSFNKYIFVYTVKPHFTPGFVIVNRRKRNQRKPLLLKCGATVEYYNYDG